jgi:hypothetical protein
MPCLLAIFSRSVVFLDKHGNELEDELSKQRELLSLIIE